MIPNSPSGPSAAPPLTLDGKGIDILQVSRERVRELCALYTAVFNADPWRDDWTEEAAEERISQFVSFPGFRGLAAYDASTPVGLVLGWKERWVQGWVFHIKEMCVAEQMRGRGIGSRLLSELEQLFSAEGVKSAYLETGNVAPARGFYEKRGYELISLVSLKKKF